MSQSSNHLRLIQYGPKSLRNVHIMDVQYVYIYIYIRGGHRLIFLI